MRQVDHLLNLGSASLPSAVKVMTQSYNTCNCDTVLTEASGSSPHTDVMGVLPRFIPLGPDINVFCVLKCSADFAKPSDLQLPFHRKNYMNFV